METPLNNGKLEKIKIKAFKKPDFSEEVSSAAYETNMIPEKYSVDYKIARGDDQVIGGVQSPQYIKSEPKKLALDFLFDRTGVIPGYEADNQKGVEEDLEKFKKAIFDYAGDIHKPYYLKINWGTLIFKGVLTDLSIDFKLFSPNGKPLRAVAKCNFLEFVDKELGAAEQNQSSPDLTHMRTVKDGETLPLMTYLIYGDSKYYLEVARLNNLTNFRKITPGQQIWFPPLEKKS